MSKTYIAYDDEKVIIGFKNADGELEYTLYTAEDGGTLEEFSFNTFADLVDEYGIDEIICEVKELKK
jgi:hypothetical protein